MATSETPPSIEKAKAEYAELAAWFATASAEVQGAQQRITQIQQAALNQQRRADVLRGWMLAKDVPAEEIEALENAQPPTE